VEKVKELHLRKTDIFMEEINKSTIPLRPGVLRVIDEAIVGGLKLAVCSTSSVFAVTNLVDTLMGPDRAAKFFFLRGQRTDDGYRVAFLGQTTVNFCTEFFTVGKPSAGGQRLVSATCIPYRLPVATVF